MLKDDLRTHSSNTQACLENRDDLAANRVVVEVRPLRNHDVVTAARLPERLLVREDSDHRLVRFSLCISSTSTLAAVLVRSRDDGDGR